MQYSYMFSGKPYKIFPLSFFNGKIGELATEHVHNVTRYRSRHQTVIDTQIHSKTVMSYAVI